MMATGDMRASACGVSRMTPRLNVVLAAGRPPMPPSAPPIAESTGTVRTASSGQARASRTMPVRIAHPASWALRGFGRAGHREKRDAEGLDERRGGEAARQGERADAQREEDGDRRA